jgi:hypothetical protein
MGNSVISSHIVTSKSRSVWHRKWFFFCPTEFQSRANQEEKDWASGLGPLQIVHVTLNTINGEAAIEFVYYFRGISSVVTSNTGSAFSEHPSILELSFNST